MNGWTIRPIKDLKKIMTGNSGRWEKYGQENGNEERRAQTD